MISLFVSSAFAQDAAAAPSGPAGFLGPFMPIIIIFIIFYFLVLRPQQKAQKAKQAMIDALKRGDEVLTAGGMYGKVTDLKDSLVWIQIANNVTVKMERAQIISVVANDNASKS